MPPAFPENGPSSTPVFDGLDLKLLKHATPPETLVRNVDKLGLELKDGKLESNPSGKQGEFVWPPPKGSELEKILQKKELEKWDYDLFLLEKLSGGFPLTAMAQGVIRSHGLVEKLQIDEDSLSKYLNGLERTYNACVYHNPMHAADVMHGTNFLLAGKLAEKLEADELLALLLSGPAHDLGHPGVNNTYLNNAAHAVSTQYDKVSVLENHHVNLALRIMDQPGMDVLSFMQPARRAEIQKMMRDIVLLTDMTLHKALLEKLDAFSKEDRSLDFGKTDDRILMMQTLLHTADLGNPCKPWNIHIQWTHAIVAEFFSQGDLERSEGKHISPMCDRNENCGRSSQKNFIKFFVRPLFVLCGEVIPDTAASCAMCIKQLDMNVDRWTELGF